MATMATASANPACPCNEYPLKPHFYIAKLGYAGVCLFFLFLLQNIDCGYSSELPRRGGSNEYPQSVFLSKNKKNIEIFLLKVFNFYNLRKIYILHGYVFVMRSQSHHWWVSNPGPLNSETGA